MKKLILSLAFVISGILAHPASAQTTQWWDDNGTNPATDGTWDTTSTNWTESSTLAPSTDLFTNGNYVIFAAGSNTTSAMNISVAEAVTCTGLGDGTTSTGTASGAYITTLNLNDGGGSINLPAGTWPIECGNGGFPAGIYITATMTGPGGIAQHNGAGLALYGNNTYSGGTVATGGQIIYFNNPNSFGSGPISTSGGGTSLWNQTGSVITLTNAFNINSGTTVLNWAGGNVICSGPWTLGTTLQLKNNAGNTPVTISGPISGAFGLQPQCDNSGATITLSGANTYTGPTGIGWLANGATTIVNVSNINSVTTPPQQASSSLGVPSSAANGTITMGYAGFAGQLNYSGPGETSDRSISLTGTTGGAIIEMDGAGPLVLAGSFITKTNGNKTVTLQGSSTATNTIAGAIANGGSGTVSLTKAQSGTWVLTGTNTYTGTTRLSAGTLIIAGTGKLANGTPLTLTSGTFEMTSTTAQTFSGTVSGAAAFIEAAPNATTTLSGNNTFTGLFTVNAGVLAFNADTNMGAPPGSFLANDFTLNGGPQSGLRANANNININANRGITLGANGGEIQVAGSDTCTYNGVISGSGVFQMGQNASTGLGTLVLTGVQTYTGPTVIANGTLSLSSGGSIASSSGLTMSNSTIFDVSGQNPFSLGGSIAFFTAFGGATTATTVRGPSGGNVDFSSQTINLSFVPSSAAGDTNHPALLNSQGTLLLNGNINLTNASALNLGAGTYTLIQGTNGGVVSATGPLTLNYFGTPLAPATAAALAIDGSGNLNLVITSTAAPGSFTGVKTQPDGTILLSFSGTAGANYVIQSATNLTPPVVWNSISTNTAGGDGTFQYNDLTATNLPVQFYRAMP